MAAMTSSLSLQSLKAPQTLLAIVLLPVVLYSRNPAIGLLVGAAISLTFNKQVIHRLACSVNTRYRPPSYCWG